MITTIIFDIGEVYLKGIVGSAKYVQQKTSIPISDYYFYEKEFDQLILGQITEDAYWKAIIKKNSWSISIKDLKKSARKNFKEIRGTRKIIEGLRQKGYKLGLLSNHVKEWVEYCELTYNYHKLFHKRVYSYEVGFSKPNKDIFLALLKKLKVKPEECIFIDDYLKNIEIARELGMNVIQFTSARNLKKHLLKLKIIKLYV